MNINYHSRDHMIAFNRYCTNCMDAVWGLLHEGCGQKMWHIKDHFKEFLDSIKMKVKQ